MPISRFLCYFRHYVVSRIHEFAKRKYYFNSTLLLKHIVNDDNVPLIHSFGHKFLMQME